MKELGCFERAWVLLKSLGAVKELRPSFSLCIFSCFSVMSCGEVSCFYCLGFWFWISELIYVQIPVLFCFNSYFVLSMYRNLSTAWISLINTYMTVCKQQ